jgi:hypothetical protein
MLYYLALIIYLIFMDDVMCVSLIILENKLQYFQNSLVSLN